MLHYIALDQVLPSSSLLLFWPILLSCLLCLTSAPRLLFNSSRPLTMISQFYYFSYSAPKTSLRLLLSSPCLDNTGMSDWTLVVLFSIFQLREFSIVIQPLRQESWLKACYAKCGLRINSIGTSWELVRNTDSDVTSGLLNLNLFIWVVTRIPRWLCVYIKSEKHWARSLVHKIIFRLYWDIMNILYKFKVYSVMIWYMVILRNIYYNKVS